MNRKTKDENRVNKWIGMKIQTFICFQYLFSTLLVYIEKSHCVMASAMEHVYRHR